MMSSSLGLLNIDLTQEYSWKEKVVYKLGQYDAGTEDGKE